MNNNGNKKTLFAFISAAAVAVFAVALVIFTVSNSRRITEQNREYLVDNAVQVAQTVDSALTDGYANIKILSTLVSESLTEPEYEVANIQQHIQNSVFDFIEFADRDGMDHNITGGVSDARDRKYYLDAREGNCGMELIYVSRATHETLLMFYSPVYYHGEFVGSLVGVYQAANRITRLLSSEYFGMTADAYLATAEGRIIASNMGFDPQNEMYIGDLAQGDAELEALLNSALGGPGTVTFSLPGNKTGGCIVPLPENGGYLVQIFPAEAGRRMIREANSLAYALVAVMIVLYACILTAIVRFYRNQQRQVEEARNQAEIASNAKTAFLFNMSHDIRTPMNAILGYTDIGLRHAGDAERSVDSFRKIKTAGGHLLKLINDILEMSRIESGKLELSETPLDIREAIEGTAQMSEALAMAKDIDFSTVIKEIKTPYIYADELHINEVLINLISNAIKYSDAGSRVEFLVEQLDGLRDGAADFRFTVKDNGIGISEDFQEHLFESFSREKTSTVSKQEGAGLGLSIVKKIVDLAGGTVEVSSKPGEGSEFIVGFPFRVMDDEAVRAFRAQREKSSGDGAVSAAGRRVLLVEDNEMNREIAEDILTEAGYEVETAEDGEIAVRLFTEKGPDYYDFTLMDIQMPVMNGYEATRAIRAMYPDAHIPIIAVSANAFAEDKAASLAAGMDDHVAKPIDINVLHETMQRLAK